MRPLRALAWASGLIATQTAVATGCWLLTGDRSWDVGITACLIPNLIIGLLFGYRMVRARVGNLMPFVVAVLSIAPTSVLGWTAYQGLKSRLGKQLGPMPVERFATLKDRKAVSYRLSGRILWRQGISKLMIWHRGKKRPFQALPFVPVSFRAGQPIPVWLVGKTHRFKPHDFDGCGYPDSVPCTITVYPPRLHGLRLALLQEGVGPKWGGLAFVALRGDADRLWMPKRLAISVGPLWLLLLSLWIWRMMRSADRQRAADAERAAERAAERKRAAADKHAAD